MAEIHETSVVVAAAAPLFDATEYVRGNGYRSLLALIQIFVEKTVLFCFVLFCFVLFCFILFCFVLFYFVLFCFILFYFVLFCFIF